MNKYIPIIIVVAFWALFYVGNKYTGIGDVIAICSVILLFMCILYGLKSYLKKYAQNNKQLKK